MKLSNFTLDDPAGTILLHGLNRHWDLHNFAVFMGLAYSNESNRFEMAWTAPRLGNPWGDDRNDAKGCKLVFRDVLALSICGDWRRLPHEQECVANIVQVILDDQDHEESPKVRQQNKNFALLFCFQSGRTVQVQSEYAELVPEDE